MLQGVHGAVDELNGDILPEGVSIHPFMDRTDLVNTTLHTVSHTLFEGMLLVVLVLILFLGRLAGRAAGGRDDPVVAVDRFYPDEDYGYSRQPCCRSGRSTSGYWSTGRS